METFNSLFFIPNLFFLFFSICCCFFSDLENFKTHRRSSVSVREGQGVVLLCGPPPHSGGKNNSTHRGGSVVTCVLLQHFPCVCMKPSLRWSSPSGGLKQRRCDNVDRCPIGVLCANELALSKESPLKPLLSRRTHTARTWQSIRVHSGELYLPAIIQASVSTWFSPMDPLVNCDVQQML